MNSNALAMALGRVTAASKGRNAGLEEAAKLVDDLARDHKDAVATYKAHPALDDATKAEHTLSEDLAWRYAEIAARIRLLKTETTR